MPLETLPAVERRATPARLLAAAAALLSVVLIIGLDARRAAPVAEAEPLATTVRTAVVLINFTDDPIDPSPAYRDAVAARYFGATGSMRSYYTEASDGRVAFAPLAGRPAVLGPWTVGMAAGCDVQRMAAETREQLTAHGIGAADYDRLSIVFPNGKAECAFGGLGQQPGPLSWLPSDFPVGALVHEMGHNLGYHHLFGVRCDEGRLTRCADVGWRGSSPMGKGRDRMGPAATELIKSGWHTPEQLLRNPANGRYSLVPLHAPASTAGRRMLDLPIDGAGGRVVVSFRKAGTTIDTGVESGVMLHKTSSDNYGLAWLVDATPVSTPDGDNVLPVGATITTETGVAITVESVSDGSAVIRVHDPRSSTTAVPTTTAAATTTAMPTTTAPPTTTKPSCPWWWPFC